jgi:hypothetical protein
MFWSSNPWIRIGIQPKMLDPRQMNTVLNEYCFFELGINPRICIRNKGSNPQKCRELLALVHQNRY